MRTDEPPSGVDTTEQDPTKLWMTTKSAYSAELTLQRTPSWTVRSPFLVSRENRMRNRALPKRPHMVSWTACYQHAYRVVLLWSAWSDVSATNIVKDHIFKPGRAASHRPAQLELAEEPGVILVQRCKVITGSCSVNVLLTTCKTHEWALKLNSWCDT